MIWELIQLDKVIEIHDEVLNLEELTGFAGDKSLDAALMRVENRVNFGMIEDEYHLAATYAMAIATGHCFNDANKRTAYTILLVCLDRHDMEVLYDEIELAKQIIDLAQGKIDETQLANWLRKNRQSS